MRGPMLCLALLLSATMLAQAEHDGVNKTLDSTDEEHHLDDGHGHEHCACHARKHGWALHCRNATANDTLALSMDPKPLYAAAAFEALSTPSCFPTPSDTVTVPTLAIEESLLTDASALAMSLPARALSLEGRLELAATIEWISTTNMTCQQWWHVLQAHHDDCPDGGLDPFMERGYHFLPIYEHCDSDFSLKFGAMNRLPEDSEEDAHEGHDHGDEMHAEGDEDESHAEGDEDHAEGDEMHAEEDEDGHDEEHDHDEESHAEEDEDGHDDEEHDDEEHSDAPAPAPAPGPATEASNIVPLLCPTVGECADIDAATAPLVGTLATFNCTEACLTNGVCGRAFHQLHAWHAKCPLDIGTEAAISFHTHEAPCVRAAHDACKVSGAETHVDHEDHVKEDCGGYPIGYPEPDSAAP